MTALQTRAECNAFRLRDANNRGHYESYFQRANHGTRRLAFWIRYTALVPRGRPEQACGEIWAIYFDGERGRIVAVKERYPLASCEFSPTELSARIGAAELAEGRLRGSARSAGHAIGWQLEYAAAEPPLLLLPERLYAAGFPKAKSLVGSPNARFRGTLEVDGAAVAIDDWIGSQNHNWGERHTDRYAWGQVAGFDDAAEAFLECASAKLRVGPLWTPWITPIVLRLDGREHRFNRLTTALRASARLRELAFSFASSAGGVRIAGRIDAPPSAFVALRYDDPSGRIKTCLNTKIARCELRLQVPGAPARVLRSESRTAFELLTDGETWGVPLAL